MLKYILIFGKEDENDIQIELIFAFESMLDFYKMHKEKYESL